MQTKVNKLDILNKLIYENLSKILKEMNKRIHIKLYALVYDEKQNLVERVRVKKIVTNGVKSSSISQDTLQSLVNVCAELKVDPTLIGNTYDEFKVYFNENWFNQHEQTETSDGESSIVFDPVMEGGHSVTVESQINVTSMLYTNQVPFHDGNSTYSVVYILEIRNIDYETRQIFYMQPEISFLRMLLDNFFKDFFAYNNHAIEVNNDDTINLKYNEDAIHFNRRLTRLFFGKMQYFLHHNIKMNGFRVEYENEQRNEYYVNSLLEKMDDISCLTYENANPFGSILFVNKDVIAEQTIIRFTITFTKEDRIRLEDAKRIRKLLELTNMDMDLYLIADEEVIYGLGEVNWNMQGNSLALRLDFTGLSKYNLILVRTETDAVSNGKLFIEDEKKYYRSDLSLIETKLVSVNFKNPRLGEEGYSTEKFTHLLKNMFWEDHSSNDQIKNKIKRLDYIVRKAREQKHGTMVVITEPLTAMNEISLLSKQSTPIEPGIINPEYIKYLTAIDGAIYIDTDGKCHAIGVILDGKVKKNVGDASRGARYNSAHRYLHKLKDDEQKKCVIVIISEDGMVDLIPESEHEVMLLELADEIIDMINQESHDAIILKEKENILLQSKIVDCDWLFNVADVYYKSKDFGRATDFLEYGITRAEKSYIRSQIYNKLGNCYHSDKKHEDALNMYRLAIEATNNDRNKRVYLGNSARSYISLAVHLMDEKKEFEKELTEAVDCISQCIEMTKTFSFEPRTRDYIFRGVCYMELSKIEKSQNKKTQLLELSIEDFSQAIILEPENDGHYWYRYYSYERLGHLKEGIEDLIQAEYIKHEDKYIEKLSRLLEKQSDLIIESIEFFNNLAKLKEAPPQLAELMSIHMAKAEMSNQEEAAAGKEVDLDGIQGE